jgi:beta-glucosidase
MRKTKTSLFLAVAGVLGFGLFAVETGSSVAGLSAIKPIKQSAAVTYKNYYSAYNSEDEVFAKGKELGREISDEGMILLKNDGTLPLAGVKNITVFGKASVNPSIGGGGSGSSKGVFTPVGLYDSLDEAGFVVNPKMKAFYSDASRSGPGRHSGSGMFGGVADVGETPVDSIDNATKASFSAYNDAAIMFITRTGSEGSDIPTTDIVDDNTKDTVDGTKYKHDTHYLELSYNEKQTLALAEANFGKVILVVNSSNPMELGEVQADAKVNGILWTGGPGGTGFYAVGDILTGKVNPSGHTVDIFPADFTKDPTFQNFGDNHQTSAAVTTNGKVTYPTNYTLTGPSDGTGIADFNKSSSVNKYLEYEEGIYVGYKYYETMATDKATEGEAWYKDNVVYPFGYGLSYTTFSMTLKSATLDGNVATALTKTTKAVKMIVTVENTGSVAGKKVVEAFANPTYIEGGIEKASRNLVGFAKTKLLEPGETEDVEIDFNVEDMGSYDYNDANKDGHMGYEIDAGDIVVGIQSDSHTVEDRVTFNAAATIDYDTDGVTSNKVVNQFSAKVSKPDGTASDVDNPYRSLPLATDGVKFTAMTRASANHLVMPAAPAAGDGTLTASGYALAYGSSIMTPANSEGTADVGQYLTVEHAAGTVLANQRQTKAAISAKGYDQEKTGTVTFATLDGKAYDDADYETALNEMSWYDIVNTVTNCGWQNGAATSIGKPRGTDIDGPSGVYCVDYPVEATIAATYNVELAAEFGDCIGEESLWGGRNGWYGPAMDTHRSPFSGRCFEYYSEDGLLGGKIAAASIKAAQKKGVYAFMKHMALNDQETTRSGIHTFASEQALREIYFKPFRYAAEEGGSKAVMGGMNAIGFVANYDDYAEMTNMLRGEWGFDGFVETDAGSFNYGTSPYSNGLMARIAGCDTLLGFGSLTAAQLKANFGTWDATKKVPVLEDGTELWNLYSAYRQSMKRLLYVTANSNTQKNHLDFAAWTAAATELDAGAGVAFSGSVAADKTVVGTQDVHYTATGLPTGVSISTQGVISGTIANSGTYKVTVTAHADGWITYSKTVNIVVAPTFAIDKTEGTVGTAFTAQISSEKIVPSQTTSATVTVNYGLKAGSTLPAGLSMDANGAITGTPTAAGTFTFTLDVIQLTTTSGSSGSTTSKEFFQDFTLTIAQSADYKDPTQVAQETADKATSDAASANAAAAAANAAASAANANATSANAAAATANSDAATANAAAEKAAAAAKSASTLGVVGMVVGIVGIVAACGALVLVFLKKKN